MQQKELFIGSSREGLKYAKKLKELLDVKLQAYGIECILWNDLTVLSVGTTIIEGLCQKANELKKQGGYAVMIMTPDDEVNARGEVRYVPRDNVVFELGLFLGYLGRERVYCVAPSNVNIKMMSDWLGVTNATYKYAERQGNKRLTTILGNAANRIQQTIDGIERPKVSNIQYEYASAKEFNNTQPNKSVLQIIENNIEKHKKEIERGA